VFEELFAAAGRRLADYVTLLPVDPSVEFEWRDGARLALSSICSAPRGVRAAGARLPAACARVHALRGA
jgi:phytoene desaturase